MSFSSPSSQSVLAADSATPCRFCRLFAGFTLGLATLFGLATALPLVVGAVKSDAAQPALGLLVANALRSSAVAATGSALLLALTLWAHPLSPSALQAQLRRMLTRAALVTLPGYLVAALLAVEAGCALAAGLGQSWPPISALAASSGWADLAAGAVAAALDAALIGFLAWRYLARLQAGGASLAAKLVIVVTVTVPLRATVGLVGSSLWGG